LSNYTALTKHNIFAPAVRQDTSKTLRRRFTNIPNRLSLF